MTAARAPRDKALAAGLCRPEWLMGLPAGCEGAAARGAWVIVRALGRARPPELSARPRSPPWACWASAGGGRLGSRDGAARSFLWARPASLGGDSTPCTHLLRTAPRGALRDRGLEPLLPRSASSETEPSPNLETGLNQTQVTAEARRPAAARAGARPTKCPGLRCTALRSRGARTPGLPASPCQLLQRLRRGRPELSCPGLGLWPHEAGTMVRD